MSDFTRRNAIKSLAAGSVGITLAAMTDAPADAGAEQARQAANIARAFRGQHQPKPLSFDPAKLRGLSEKLVRSHWENNYGGAVKALNAVEQRLDSMMKDKDLPAYIYGDVKREELARTGSVILHEHYFSNLGGDGKPAGAVLESIKQWFGSYEEWEGEFKRTANALGGGSGWAILAHNLHTGELHNYWAGDHMHNAPMSRPLLVLDMYEHAYHMDYGAAAARYIDAFIQNVRWEEVNRRAEAAAKATLS